MTHLNFVVIRDGFQELVPIAETTRAERFDIAADLRRVCLSSSLSPDAISIVAQCYRTLLAVLAFDKPRA